jgi:hypothetical protein
MSEAAFYVAGIAVLGVLLLVGLAWLTYRDDGDEEDW